MFDLKTKWENGHCLAKNLSIGERENGASGEQIVLYVLFAGFSLKLRNEASHSRVSNLRYFA